MDTHPTLVLRESGWVVPLPPGFAPISKPPALPPRPKPVDPSYEAAVARASEIPVAEWGVLWNMMKAPLIKKKDAARKGSDGDIKPAELKGAGGSPLSMSGAIPMGIDTKKELPDFYAALSQNPLNQLPPSPPKSVRHGLERFDSSAPTYARPNKWESLFATDSTPTPIFIALMSTLFAHLDPDHTGYVSPEVYSSFLDIQGYQWTANIWKNALDSDAGTDHKDVADLELGLYFSDLGISHTLMTRPKEPVSNTSSEPPKSPVAARLRDSMTFSANMPMLSRQGFIDLSAIEYLVNPAQGYAYLKRAVEEYGVWKELGEMPRDCLPDSGMPKISQVDKNQPKIVEQDVTSESAKDVTEVKVEEKEEEPTTNGHLPIKVNGGEKKVEALLSPSGFEEVDLMEKARAEVFFKSVKTEADKQKEIEAGKLAAKLASESEDEKTRSSSESSGAFMDLYKENN